MRVVTIGTFVVLLGVWLCACCDCAQMVSEKESQVSELEEQVAALTAKVAELESAAAEAPKEEPAPKQPVEEAPADLASCIERLKACELDPFKGGKYFMPEKVDPAAAGKPADGPAKGDRADLLDPFKDKLRPAPAKGEVVDPFAKK